MRTLAGHRSASDLCQWLQNLYYMLIPTFFINNFHSDIWVITVPSADRATNVKLGVEGPSHRLQQWLGWRYKDALKYHLLTSENHNGLIQIYFILRYCMPLKCRCTLRSVCENSILIFHVHCISSFQLTFVKCRGEALSFIFSYQSCKGSQSQADFFFPYSSPPVVMFMQAILCPWFHLHKFTVNSTSSSPVGLHMGDCRHYLASK